MSIAGGRVTYGVGANLIGLHSQARNQEATLYVGNLDTKVNEDLLWVSGRPGRGERAPRRMGERGWDGGDSHIISPMAAF